jgi:hypothetical protein
VEQGEKLSRVPLHSITTTSSDIIEAEARLNNIYVFSPYFTYRDQIVNAV